MAVDFGRQLALSERVAPGRVKPGRHHDQFGVELKCVKRERVENGAKIVRQLLYLIAHGHDDVEKGQKILRVAEAGTVPRNVDVESLSRPAPRKVEVRVRLSGEESPVVVTVERDVQHAGVLKIERLGFPNS